MFCINQFLARQVQIKLTQVNFQPYIFFCMSICPYLWPIYYKITFMLDLLDKSSKVDINSLVW